MLVSGGVGIATVAALDELIDQDATAAVPDNDRETMMLDLFSMLMICGGYLIIGVVGVVSNSLLLHGVYKVTSSALVKILMLSPRARVTCSCSGWCGRPCL